MSRFGVKILNDEIVVEDFGFSSVKNEFQFEFSDKLSFTYNGNDEYSIDITPLREQENIVFYDWKLISLRFPGNWYGQCGRWVMEDSCGERMEFVTTRQSFYIRNQKQMIKESLERAKKIANENLSVEYHKIISKKIVNVINGSFYGIPQTIVSFEECTSQKRFDNLRVLTGEFLQKYEKIMECLVDRNDERSCFLKDKLKEKAVELLREYNSFKIKLIDE